MSFLELQPHLEYKVSRYCQEQFSRSKEDKKQWNVIMVAQQ